MEALIKFAYLNLPGLSPQAKNKTWSATLDSCLWNQNKELVLCLIPGCTPKKQESGM